jgi:hypothetical protein
LSLLIALIINTSLYLGVQISSITFFPIFFFSIFWDIMPCSPVETDVSEENIAYRVNELVKQETSMK